MGSLTGPLRVIAAAAVTPVGLDGPQTFAAIRAGVSGYEEMLLNDPFGAVQTVARIPANWRLKRTDGHWLLNMAARVLGELLERSGADPTTTALFLAGPEAFRNHPANETWPSGARIRAIESLMGLSFGRGSREIEGGPAALLGSIVEASRLLGRGAAERVILLGADSYVTASDIGRLTAAHRISAPDNAQGLVPGEASAAVCLAATGTGPMILGASLAAETDTALGPRQSSGRGMLEALRKLTEGSDCPEAAVDFVISNFNGERYAALEALVYRSRFYRTHRAYMATPYPAMSVGEVGSAAAPLAMALLADSFAHDYAPGETATCEISSESGTRAAAYIVRGL